MKKLLIGLLAITSVASQAESIKLSSGELSFNKEVDGSIVRITNLKYIENDNEYNIVFTKASTICKLLDLSETDGHILSRDTFTRFTHGTTLYLPSVEISASGDVINYYTSSRLLDFVNCGI